MSEFWHLTGSKHHLMVDAHGIPLAMTLTGGNRNDVTQLLPLLDAVPPIRGLGGPGARLASCSPTAATTSTSTDDCSANAASPAHRPPRRRPRSGLRNGFTRTKREQAQPAPPESHPSRTARDRAMAWNLRGG
jgi:hypothetical protein